MTSINPEHYEQQLEQKRQRLKHLFQDSYDGDIDVFASPKTHYRMRAEFRLWYKNNEMHYVMFKKGDSKTPVFISEFPQAHAAIADLMFPLLEAINAVPLLAVRLFQIEFLTTQSGETLVSLIYHKNLSDDWEAAARTLQKQFNIHIIGRARKQKRVLDRDFVTESLCIAGKVYHYRQYEGSFSQPNAKVCEKMVEWILSHCEPAESDLLELYCGNGNFTLPLASRFRQVLATESSKVAIKAARENAGLNHIDNVTFVRLSSQEAAQALAGVRQFRRLENIALADYRFDTVFVDPPRAGLDAESLALVKNFKRILYISCNPATLHENIQQLASHELRHLALFDQFPYTDHMECGAILEKSRDDRKAKQATVGWR